MSRHATLTSANKELVERDRINNANIDKYKSESAQSKEDSRVEMLNNTNQIAVLAKNLEDARLNTLSWY